MALDLSNLFEDIFKNFQIGSLDTGLTFDTPENRKAKWEKTQTNPISISLFNFRLEFNFSIPQFRWSFNFNLNFLISIHITFQFRIPTPDLEPYVKHKKARYGEARYGESYYDPPGFTNAELQKALWDVRYLFTHWKDFYPKTKLATAEMYKEIIEAMFESAGVSDAIKESAVPTALIYEGKLLTAAYVGMCVVDIARVMPTPTPDDPLGKFYYSSYYMRDPSDCATWIENRTVTAHEPTVDFARVGYCTVAPSTQLIKDLKARSTYRLIPKEINDYFKKQVEQGRAQFAPQKIPTPEGAVTYQPYSISQMNYETCQKKRFAGGKHQYIMQDIIVRVKRILDRHGVVNWFRKAYIDFALEYAYMYYDSPNRKNWKRALSSPQPIIEKYIKQGCDERIIEDIVSSIQQVKGGR